MQIKRRIKAGNISNRILKKGVPPEKTRSAKKAQKGIYIQNNRYLFHTNMINTFEKMI